MAARSTMHDIPDGIPTTLEIQTRDPGTLSSGLVMYPEGHARNTSGNLTELLAHKFRRLAGLGIDDPREYVEQFGNLRELSANQLAGIYDVTLRGLR